MNYLFLHISDTHFYQNEDFPTEKVNRIVRVIPEGREYSLIALVISGDLANACEESEYEHAEMMIAAIEDGMKRYCDNCITVFVPGNHDIRIPNESCSAEEILNKQEVSMKDAYCEELEKMDPFFSFSSRRGLFNSDYSHHVINHSIDNDCSIKFTLLNSAPFSTREKTNKQLHYLPEDAIESIKKDAETQLNIVVMHHGQEWFADEAKRRLEQALFENCDILFIGHEHDGFSEEHTNSNNQHLYVSRGGVFDASYYEESSFSTIFLNTEEMTSSESYFRWDKQQSLYVETQNKIRDVYFKKPGQVFPEAQFLSAMSSSSDFLGIPLSNYFVFPNLDIDLQIENEDFQTITSEDSFFDLLDSHSCINIIGAKNSGKTSLLKRLYLDSIERGFSPLFLGKDNNRPSHTALFSDLIREQYGDSDTAKSAFDQVTVEKTILFIDDFDMLKKNLSDDAFIRETLNKVGVVVFVSNRDLDTNIVEGVKRELGSDNAIQIYRIKDFYKEKRDALITNLCSHMGASAKETEDIITIIDKSVHGHRKLFSLNPAFILQNARFYLESGTSERDDVTPFSEIFEANTIKQIEGALSKISYGKTKQGAVREVLVLLGEIAYFMHKNKQSHISSDQLRVLMKEYDDEYGLGIEVGALVDLIREANLMQPDKFTLEIKFNSENIHAYFVAKRIESMMQQDAIEWRKDVEYLLANVCFSINENILLFLSYLLNDIGFAEQLLRHANDALSTYEALSLDQGTIGMLSHKPDTRVKMISKQSREEGNKSISAQEEAMSERINADILEYKGIYEYSEDDSLTDQNRILRATKYLEMAGKSLITHYARMPMTKKGTVVQGLYELPNKILYAMLSGVDEHFEEIIDGLYETLSQDESVETISKVEIRDLFFKLGMIACLELYDQIAFYCSNPQTVELLANFETQDTSHRIQRLLMIENAYLTEEYIEVAIRQIDQAKKNNNTQEIISIRAITNKHLFQHPGIKQNLLQKIGDKIFGGKQNKQIMRRNKKGMKRD